MQVLDDTRQLFFTGNEGVLMNGGCFIFQIVGFVATYAGSPLRWKFLLLAMPVE